MKLYVCSIDGLMDLPGKSLLSAARSARMMRYRQMEDRARCLAAGLMLRAVLGDCEEKMILGSKGKPFLSGGPQFNLSHSGRYVILGVSEGEIGVDIEQIAPYDMRVARRCYTDEELTWLYEQDSENRFYRLWTAKESVMKATGKGFSMPPESFCVLPVENGLHEIEGRRWFLSWTQLPGHAVCAACAREEKMSLSVLSRETLLMK